MTNSVVSNVSHGTLTLNSNGTFTYTPQANYSGTDSFTWKVNDGTADSNTATATINVTAVNDAPIVTTTGGTTAFVETANATFTPVAIDSGLTVADSDNATLASASVSIAWNFYIAQDILSFTNDGISMGNISASYNTGTGVLTMTSSGNTATLSQWQAALREVKYTNSSDNPNTTNRTITYGGVDVRLTSDKKGISDFQGGKVTLKVPFTVPSGMETKQFVIWYVAEDGKKTKLDTAYQDGALVATLSHFSEYIIAYHEVPFSDVPMDAYFANAVEWAVKNSITNGTTETTFSPDTTCTRAQTVVFLWRAAGSPKPQTVNNPFTDVIEGAYYYDAVLWAVENGITAGTTASSFSPDATVTRAQVVTFQWRSAKAPVLDAENPFQDVATDSYCYNAVLWAAKEGVTGGLTATTFGPENDCTRGQIVTFLHRYVTK